MVAPARHKHQHKKRLGQHQKHTKQFKQVYWPYIPLATILIISLLFSWYWDSRSGSATLPYATSMSISQLLAQTNVDRTNNGSGVLNLSSQLNQAAQAKANDMVARNYWSHNTPDGQEPWIFINNTGYKYQKAGENLAYGFMTSNDTVAGWMNSSTHRANMLDGAFQDVGFGFANSSNFNSDGEETVVVAMYGKPVVLAATAPPQAQTSNPAASKPSAAPTPIAEQTPAPAPVEEKPKVEEKPVTTEQATLIEPSTRSISRIQALTRGAMPWISSSVVIVALAGISVLIIKHGLALRRMIRKGERYVLHHLAFDSAVIAFVGFVFLLTRTAGVIK